MDSQRPEKLILCVEDHDGMAQFLRDYLSRFPAEFAASYDEAHRLLDEHHFSLFLLDYHLEDNKTGLDLCRCIRERGIRTPVFVMSVSGDLDTETVRQAGGNGFIRKNHEFTTVLDAILDSVLGTK